MRGSAIESSTSTSVALVRLLLDPAEGLGLPVEEILRSQGLRADRLEDRDARLPDEQYEALFHAVAARSGDPDFGLRLGAAARRFPRGHILTAILLNGPTVGGALERFFRYHGLLADGVVPRLRRREPDAWIVLEVPRPGRQRIESLMSLVCAVARQASEGRCRVRRARFTHAEPDSTAEHVRVFDCPLEFEAPENALGFDAVDLDRPLPLADPELLRTVEALAGRRLERLTRARDWSSRTRHEIGRCLLAGRKPGVEAVAGTLAVGGRTLQSRLENEGASFRQLLDEVREGLACDALTAGDASLCEIAFLVGFAEQSAFNHAFKRWTGTTPTRFRAKARSGE